MFTSIFTGKGKRERGESMESNFNNSSKRLKQTEEAKPCVNLTVNTASSAGQYCPTHMEDEVRVKKLENEKWGPVLISVVADGHASSAVSLFLKRNIVHSYKKIFKNQDHESMSTNLENLDHIMISVLRNMNIDLQNQIVKNKLVGGSTLVATFTFLNFGRLYTLNVGDSRMTMFETETGELVHSVCRIIDLEDGLDTVYSKDDLQPTCTKLHKVHNKLKIPKTADPNLENQLKVLESKPGKWSNDFVEKLEMRDDVDRRGMREWGLWLDNKETNPRKSLQLVRPRNDGQLVIGRNGRLNMTRSLGDYGISMHLGEIYIADVPTDREVSFLLCSDGLEEGIKHEDMAKYLCHPKQQLRHLLEGKHKFTEMSLQYEEFFKTKGLGAYPEGKDMSIQLKWLERCVEKLGRTHLPSGTRDKEVFLKAISWVKWANEKYSEMPEDHKKNKFCSDLFTCPEFRLRFAIQCALCRLSFDNISGALVCLKPKEEEILTN